MTSKLTTARHRPPRSFFPVALVALLAMWAGAEARAQEQWVTYHGEAGAGKGKHIVLVSGDEEYRSEESLAQLGKILAEHHGFKATVLFAIDPDTGVIDPNHPGNIPGLEALKTADLMVIATRFRNLPDEQMRQIDDYLRSGRPIVGMRTATHAFRIPPERNDWLHYDYRYNGSKNWVHYDPRYAGDKTAWKGGFGGLVMGDTWFYHHGYHNHQSTRGLVAKEAKDRPVARGLGRGAKDGEIWGPTDVYAVRMPLPGDAAPVVMGQVMNRKGPYQPEDKFFGMRPSDDEAASTGHNPTADRGEERYNPNDPMLPVAWTKTYQVPGGGRGRVFATTMGASTDLLSAGTRRMIVNGVYWALGLEGRIPGGGTKVDLVGDYVPTPFKFEARNYWKKKGIRPAAFAMDVLK